MEPPYQLPKVVEYAIPFFILLMLAEMAYGKISHKVRYEYRDSLASLMMGAGNLAIGAVTGILVYQLELWIYQNFRLFDLPWSWWVFALCFLGEDLAYYWYHRISHERRWFWAAHVNHHSSQHYNLSTALRQTWSSFFVLGFLFWLPLALIGFHPAMILFFSGVSLVYQFWIHTEAINRLGPLEWVMNTPSHHRVHHAINPLYLDANYAGVLIIWDRLFGSFIAEQADEPCRYGVVKQIGSHNPLRIAFHEWVGIVKDVASAPSWSARWGYIWGPPGWSHDNSRLTSAKIKAAHARRQLEAQTGIQAAE